MTKFNHSRRNGIGNTWYFKCLIIFISASPGSALSADNRNPLTLHASYAIDSATASGLSGLDWCEGMLLTIDDRDDSNIYQIELNADRARLVESIQIAKPKRTNKPPYLRRLLSFVRGIMGTGTYDWEGISCMNDEIFLLSEIDGAVMQLGSNGQPTWRISGQIPKLQREGLYEDTFIGSEAITWVDEDTLLLGHERSPPAIIRVNTATDDIAVLGLNNERETNLPHLESPDITGMDIQNELLYTLHRNAMLVCIRTIDAYKVIDCRSYRNTEQSSEYKYPSMRYGRAEGIAVQNSYIYVVLDNNGDARVKNGSNRPLLFVFENPWSMSVKTKQFDAGSSR